MAPIADWFSRALGGHGTDEALTATSCKVTHEYQFKRADGSTPAGAEKPTLLDADGNPISDAAFFAAVEAGQQAEGRTLPDGRQAIALLPAGSTPATTTATPSTGVATGKPLPPFKLKLLDDSAADPSMLAGAPALVSAFYDGCDAFIDELPALDTFRASRADLHFLAITVNDAVTAKAFVERHAFTWPVACGAGDYLNKSLNVRAYPTLYLLDGAGQVLATHTGSIPYSIFGASGQSSVTQHGNVTAVTEISITELGAMPAPVAGDAIARAQAQWLDQWVTQYVPRS